MSKCYDIDRTKERILEALGEYELEIGMTDTRNDLYLSGMMDGWKSMGKEIRRIIEDGGGD